MSDDELISGFLLSLKRRRLSPNTLRLREHYIRQFANWAPDRLAGATLEDVEGYLESHDSWSAYTQQTAISSLKSFYTWAREEDHIPTNPTARLTNVRAHRRPSRMATEAQIMSALDGATVSDQAMILLGAECGLRLSEIASLHRKDRDGEWLQIVGKGNVLREVWISPELSAALDLIEQTRMRWGYYFPGRSEGHLHPTAVWKHIRARLGSNPHSLRHRAGTTVYRQTGKDIRVTQEFLGHRRPETTAIYVHVARDDLRRAGMAARLGQFGNVVPLAPRESRIWGDETAAVAQ